MCVYACYVLGSAPAPAAAAAPSSAPGSLLAPPGGVGALGSAMAGLSLAPPAAAGRSKYVGLRSPPFSPGGAVARPLPPPPSSPKPCVSSVSRALPCVQGLLSRPTLHVTCFPALLRPQPAPSPTSGGGARHHTAQCPPTCVSFCVCTGRQRTIHYVVHCERLFQ